LESKAADDRVFSLFEPRQFESIAAELEIEDGDIMTQHEIHPDFIDFPPVQRYLERVHQIDRVKTNGCFLTTLSNLLRGATFTPEGCWIGRDELLQEGYTILMIPDELTGRLVPRSGHRIAWMMVNPRSYLPRGVQIHHRCKNRSCFNPDHVQPLSELEHREYHRVGVEPRFLHRCGRPYDRFYMRKDGRLWRKCSRCRK
jgi:hypothetical protein